MNKFLKAMGSSPILVRCRIGMLPSHPSARPVAVAEPPSVLNHFLPREWVKLAVQLKSTYSSVSQPPHY
jgi:hypothetical protein